MAKVNRPAMQPAIHLTDHLTDRYEAASAASQSPDFIPRMGLSLVRREYVQITVRASVEVTIVSERKTQEVDVRPRLIQVHHASFLAIDRQFEPAFELTLHPISETLSLMSGQDDEIVRIADDLRLRPVRRAVRSVESLLEPVQVDVRKQGRNDAANDVAKNWLIFDIVIPRSRLVPSYGQGFGFGQHQSCKEVT